MVSGLTATVQPRASYAAPSDAVSSAVWVASVQPPPGSANTYTAPSSVFPPTARCGEPAAIVSALIATLEPSWSAVAPSEAVSSADCAAFVQPPAGLVYTYTAP